jgi:phosphatidylglycerol:prolipoprotein diacylglycerol transferase
MLFLIWLWRRYRAQLKPPDLFLVYLITYPMIRFFLEFLRIDFVPLWGLNFNQALMLVVAAASGFAFYLRHRPPRTSTAP